MSPIGSFWNYAWCYSQEQIIKFCNIHSVHSEELCWEMPQISIMGVEFKFQISGCLVHEPTYFWPHIEIVVAKKA